MNASLTPEGLDAATQLAVARTLLARERTMMAWVRTAASMITFGFSVYKFFQLELSRQTAPDWLVGPREFALLLITIGLGALTLAFVEHRHTLRKMRAVYGGIVTGSIAGVVAGIIAALGLVAMAIIALQQ